MKIPDSNILPPYWELQIEQPIALIIKLQNSFPFITSLLFSSLLPIATNNNKQQTTLTSSFGNDRATERQQSTTKKRREEKEREL